MAERISIGLFGGTFDPIHEGHVQMARLAKARMSLDRVHFIPCRVSPHKLDQSLSRVEDRLEMLRRAVASESWMVLDERDVRREGPSYSYLTAQEMVSEYPEARLVWMLGHDQWEALPRWKNPEILAELVEFAVFSRGGRLAQAQEGYQATMIEYRHPASATEIRRCYRDGGNKREWLQSRVAEWIEQRGLYQP